MDIFHHVLADHFNPLPANHDYSRFESVLLVTLLLRIQLLFKQQDLQMFGPKLNKYEYYSTTWGCGSR